MPELFAYLSTAEAFVQIGVVLVSIALAFITRAICTRVIRKKEAEKPSLLYKAFDYSRPIFRPLLALILISFFQAILTPYYLGSDLRLISLGYEICILWGITRLIFFSTEGNIIVGLSIIIGSIILGLSFTGHLDSLIEFMDRISFKIGTYRFSIVSLFKGIIALTILFWVAGVANKFIRFFIGRFSKLRTSNRELAAKAAQIAIYFILFMITLDVMGIDLTALAVFGGAVGVGLGFGLQKVASNFISGLVLLMEKTVEVGDVLELESGIYGHVRQIGARFTMLETLDTKEVMVPNEELITTKVTNWTFTNPTGRMEIKVGVHYNSDLDVARQALVEALQEHPRILKQPEPQALLDEFGDSSVNFRVLFWMDDVSYRYFQVKSEVMFAVWNKLKEVGIEISYPQRDLHIRSMADDIRHLIEGSANKPKPAEKQPKKDTKPSSKTSKES